MLDEELFELVDVGGNDVGEPDHLAAPVIPVSGQADVLEIVILEDDRVDSVFFAGLEGLEDFLFGIVVLCQGVHVEQVSGVHVGANEVAAADEATDGEIADLCGGHVLRGKVSRIHWLCLRIGPNVYSNSVLDTLPGGTCEAPTRHDYIRDGGAKSRGLRGYGGAKMGKLASGRSLRRPVVETVLVGEGADLFTQTIEIG